MDNKKITATEMAGELRRAARMFKVFEKAAESADVLYDIEKNIKAAEKELEKLINEKSLLDSQCDEVWAKIKIAEKELADIEALKISSLSELEQMQKTFIHSADKEANNIIASAKKKASEEQDKINALDKVFKNLQQAVAEEKHKLSSIREDIQRTKENFIKSL